MSHVLPQAMSKTLPPLRLWQATCLEQALKSLSPQQPHFLCQATPGAGKMRFAASLAKVLLDQDAVDYVLYLGPTRAVVNDAVTSLQEVTGLAMNGELGASGAGFTYHALQRRLKTLMRLGQQARVLLFWDESHHMAGDVGPDGANQWGRALMALERHVTFTVALSGTPWRTDGSCLPLLRYLEVHDEDHDNNDHDSSEERQQCQLQPDFVYTLREAIADQICRHPSITLVDNRSITLKGFHVRTGRPETHRFPSIPRLLTHPAVQYASLVRDYALIDRILTLGCQRLMEVRQHHPQAAGLVVAADILHAEEIAQRLEEGGHDVCLVTSRDPNAHSRLDRFRDGTTPWIVSVGMVSEGVDIPRLRVCCYLSQIRTETYFRQVLGRIIRRIGKYDGACYLYALNEPLLRHYARRLSDDLPADLATVTLPTPPSSHTGTTSAAPGTAAPMSDPQPGDAPSPVETNAPSAQGVALSFGAETSVTAHNADVAFSQAFFERLVALQLTS